MKCIVRFGTILFALGVLSLHAADPLVLDASRLPGRKAKLADVKAPLVLADGVATNIPAGPGRIQVQAFLRFNGKGQAYRLTPFTLTVGSESVSLPVDALAAGMPLSLTLVNRGKPLAVSLAQGVLPPEAKAERLRLETSIGTKQGPDMELADPKEKDGNDLDEFGLLEAPPIDASADPLPLVLLERIEVTPLSGPLLVASVKSDRITYKPGSTSVITVVLTNAGTREARGLLSVDFLEGLDASNRVLAGEVTVAAGAGLVRTCETPVGSSCWGRGIDVRIETPDGADRATHAFSVVTNTYMAAFPGVGLPQFGSERWTPEQAAQEAERIAQANMDAYANMYEAFAWAPCDFSQMTVENDEPFHSGQVQYSKTRPVLQTLHRVFHTYGIGCVTYGKSCASGVPGVDYALRHPEQMNVFSPAGFAHEAISVDVIDRMLENRYRRHGRDEDFWQSWISSWTLIGSLAAARFGCDEIVRSAAMFDWDAVRYDGHFSFWRNPAMSARFVKHCADRIQSQRPGFGIGYNYCGPQHDTAEGSFSDIELAACARGGGLIMSEYYRNLLGPVSNNIEHLRWVGDATRLHGGYFLTISDDASAWSSALVLAGGSRPMGGGGHFNKFATRFSAFVLDPALQRLQNPGLFIKPGANADFRWDAFVFEKPVSPTESLLILQLVNVTDRFSFSAQKRPPTGVSGPRRGIEFTLALPEGYKAGSVRAWDPAGGFSAMPVGLDGNQVTIPRLDVWTLAVVSLQKTAGAPGLAGQCEIPLRFASVKEGDLEAARAGLKIGAAVGPDTVAAINTARMKITPAVLESILALGEPEDNNPGALAYTPPAFTNHKGGADAAWFKGNAAPLRLKRDGRPDVLVVRGIFSHVDRLEEALAAIPGANVHDAYVENGRAACGSKLAADNAACLAGWPSRDRLASMDAVVLDDIPAAAFSLAQRRDLLDYVQGGGQLLVMGGWYSLSKGSWEGSFLEDALPAEVVQSSHLLRLKKDDQRIVKTDAYQEGLGISVHDFGTDCIEWINPVRPRADSKVLMKVGDQPILVAGGVGQGQVFLWAGSHSGTPASPYWKNEAWPKLLTAVLTRMVAGSDAVSPVDPAVAVRLAKAKEALEAASVNALLDEGDEPDDVASETRIMDDLRVLLNEGGEAEALAAATYLLGHPGKLEPTQFGELTDALAPKVTAAAGWAALAERYQSEPPDLLEGLVAEISAVALKSVKTGTIKKWDLRDPVTRLRCIAASGDPEALTALDAEMKQITAREKQWAALTAADNYSTATVNDLYKTRLVRPFIAYAMLKCGRRDEETLYQFCKGVLDLPYYAWRQRWILEGAYGGLAEAHQAGNPQAVIAAEGRVRDAQIAIKQLDRALAYVTPLFRPDLVTKDAEGRRAAARALKEVDCRKSLPLALAFLRDIPIPYHSEFSNVRAAILQATLAKGDTP